MLYAKLHHPIILEKQLPDIAKKMQVDVGILKKLMNNSMFYGTKDGKTDIYPMPDISGAEAYFSQFNPRFFAADAVVEYAKSKDVDPHAFTEISIPSTLFQSTSETAYKDISALLERVEMRDDRVTRLEAVHIPAVILMNELRMLREAVEQLENNHGHRSVVDTKENGRVLTSLVDVGYSLIDGEIPERMAAPRSAEYTEYSPAKLAELVKRVVGTDTQEQFASNAGVTRVYLNRLINEKSKKAPTEVTLKKLAKATKSVTENEFRFACGYYPLPKTQKHENTVRRENIMDGEWVSSNVSSFLNFLKKFVPMAAPLDSVRTIRDAFDMLYGDENDSIVIKQLSECIPYSTENSPAKLVLPILVSWFNSKRLLMQSLYIGLIGHKSVDDELYITGYITSAKELHDNIPCLKDKIERAEDAYAPDGVNVMELPTFYSTKRVQQAVLDKHQIPPAVQERF